MCNYKKVTVVIPVYNVNPLFIKDAINSVLNQSYENIEIIVVNDGSTDPQTLNYLSSLNGSNILVINQSNKGLSGARNSGIKKGSGEYILPLDADDKIAPTYVEKAVAILDENKSVGIVYCDAEYFDAISEKWKLNNFNLDDFLLCNSIFCSALYRKEDWEKVGGYDESFRDGLEDWDFWLSLIEKKIETYKIPEVLFFYRKHSSGSMIDETRKKHKNIVRRIIKKHIDLYLSNDNFVNLIVDPEQTRIFRKIYGKYKKYKTLFFNTLFLVIVVLFSVYWYIFFV